MDQGSVLYKRHRSEQKDKALERRKMRMRKVDVPCFSGAKLMGRRSFFKNHLELLFERRVPTNTFPSLPWANSHAQQGAHASQSPVQQLP